VKITPNHFLVFIFSICAILFTNYSSAQSQATGVTASPDSAQIATDPATEQKPPAAVGEEGTKPTGAEDTKPARGFISALTHNLGDDLKHIPRRNSVYWLAGGAGLALAVHPEDKDINARLVSSGAADKLFAPGHIIGSTYVVLGASAATYIFGRATDHPRAQHLGMDLIESSILAEGITQGMKVIARRDRPLQVNGGTQSKTYSFPSGHAMITFAAATVLQQHLGYKAAIPTYVIASYVAMSRLHDNRHYASDVIFGAATGIVIGRSVTWHGRNFYASPMLIPGGGGIVLMASR
jgi:membrane-associated phospholipid phosphatase